MIGVPDARFGEAVCAYVVVNAGASVTAAALIEHCRTLIASYKKPRQVRFVASLPRNSVGKVRKDALRGTVSGP